MKRLLSLLAIAAILAPVAASASTPTVNGATIQERVFNDCPASTLTTTNNYPTMVQFDDQNPFCFGFANLHAWTFSSDGGATDAVFNNDSNFRFCADLTVSGTGEAEAGTRIAPWWSKYVDGRINCRTTDGEIACFGGRMPFYSFTASNGITYVKGTTIHLEMIYLANGLSSISPATVEYKVTYNSNNYTSGPKPLDMGNPAEDPPYGLWGMLNDGRAGGFVQYFLSANDVPNGINAKFENICYESLDVVPVQTTTWGAIKGQYR